LSSSSSSSSSSSRIPKIEKTPLIDDETLFAAI
jgi:hypothetical protein